LKIFLLSITLPLLGRAPAERAEEAVFFESENFQNLKMIESKKFSTKLLKVKNISLKLNRRIQIQT